MASSNTLSSHASVTPADIALAKELAPTFARRAPGYAPISRQQLADARASLTKAQRAAIGRNRAEITRVADGELTKKGEMKPAVVALLAEIDAMYAKGSRKKSASIALGLCPQRARKAKKA